jgi:hypothetical protein
MSNYRIFWGETHDNTYQFPEQRPPIDTVMTEAAKHLDFYASAYYTACAEAFEEGGHPFESDAEQSLILEGWKPRERLAREWAEVQEACRTHNCPGEFVTFPGYEWQGDGSDGDHNVYHRAEGAPIIHVDRLAQLYERLRKLDVEALAIPHHTAYRAGVRGRDWSVIDESLSPFSEIYSVHGCSETDEELIGLRQNNHMGPGVGGGTWQDALDRGLHLGAICSTDMWGGMPGRFGDGRMACLAEELTHDSLWEAFRARRVYGVTGDRILLEFTVNGHPMGSIIACDGPRRISVRVSGSDALDRIELLRNGRVIATHCHQGTWRMPKGDERCRFKLRVEAGWGPRPNEIDVPPRQWTGRLELDGGRFTGWEPCWITPGQERVRLSGREADFGFRSPGETAAHRWQNANVFEFEASPRTPLRLELNGLTCEGTVAEFAGRSRELWYRDECVHMLKERCGLSPGSPEREDVYHHMAYKAKVHRAMPEVAWTAPMEFEDDEAFEGGEIHYRVRVEQRNGQRAWSSPIWIRPA